MWKREDWNILRDLQAKSQTEFRALKLVWSGEDARTMKSLLRLRKRRGVRVAALLQAYGCYVAPVGIESNWVGLASSILVAPSLSDHSSALLDTSTSIRTGEIGGRIHSFSAHGLAMLESRPAARLPAPSLSKASGRWICQCKKKATRRML